MPFEAVADTIRQPLLRVKRLGLRTVSAPSRRLRGIGIVNFRGLGVLNLIDVGSVGALPEPWHTHAPKIRTLLKFEPRDRSGKSPNVRTVDAALWSIEGERDFYIYRGQGGAGSSLYEQNVEFVRDNFDELRLRGPAYLARTWFERSEIDRVERISCRTLDQVLAEGDGTKYQFLKVDTQGAEYEILRGAERFLAEDCMGLHLELYTVPLYKGIPLKADVVKFLDDRGFSLVKTFAPHGSFDSQNDCVFLRRGAVGRELDEIRSVYQL